MTLVDVLRLFDIIPYIIFISVFMWERLQHNYERVSQNERHAQGLTACKNFALGLSLIAADFIPVVGEVDNAAKVVRFLEKRGVGFHLKLLEAAKFLDTSPDFEIPGGLGWMMSGLKILLPLEGIDFIGQTVIDGKAGKYKDGMRALVMVVGLVQNEAESIQTAGDLTLSAT
ncbi:hypothetical protein A3B57_00180 [Microgenomates group bacterium RIFCSPLOWO2_01_FULL_47_10]|nr:MAG: hypothetical protein A3B57_00180 [Microgenomates group bacterium RIFCSPLOWO2_01_FULL_47_10]